MSEWRDRLIILRLGLFHESNLWIRALCHDHGVFTLFAFGGAISKRRFCGCLDIFNTLDCLVKVSRTGDYLTLAEASLLTGTRNLRHNPRGMGIAANCHLFLDALNIGAENAGACFDTLENLRLCLETKAQPHRLLPLFFRLRIASCMGFRAELGICGKCGSPIRDEAFFMLDEGRVFCRDCGRHRHAAFSNYSIRMSENALETLAHAQRSLPEAWRPEALSGWEEGASARLIDAFIQYYLGLAWDNGFFRSV